DNCLNLLQRLFGSFSGNTIYKKCFWTERQKRCPRLIPCLAGKYVPGVICDETYSEWLTCLRRELGRNFCFSDSIECLKNEEIHRQTGEKRDLVGMLAFTDTVRRNEVGTIAIFQCRDASRNKHFFLCMFKLSRPDCELDGECVYAFGLLFETCL